MHAETLKALEKLDLPFPWETNKQGQVIMTPVNYDHGRYVGRLIRLCAIAAPQWESGAELGIFTSDGVKAPDVIFASAAYHARHMGQGGYVAEAPEICVEIMSSSNTWEEMGHKMLLYFEVGAQEVWIVDTGGAIAFFASDGARMERSHLIPDAPTQL